MPRRDVDDPSQCPLRSPRFWEVLQACELGRDKVFGRDVPARKRQDSGAAMTDSSRSPDIQSTNKTANEPIIQSAGRNTCSWRSSRGQVPRQCLGAASSRSRQPARLGTLRESRRDFRKSGATKRIGPLRVAFSTGLQSLQMVITTVPRSEGCRSDRDGRADLKRRMCPLSLGGAAERSS